MADLAIYAGMIFCGAVVLIVTARPKRRRRADQP